MPIIIEFVGHAGSGKTYLAKRLSDVLGDECISIEGFPMRMSDALLFIAMNPGKVVLIFKYILSSKQINVTYFMKSLRKMLVYYVKLETAMRKQAKYIIISEGVLKIFNDIRSTSAIRNMTYTHVPQSIRNRIFASPHLVIFVFSSLEVVAKRLLLREKAIVTEGDIKNEMNRIGNNFLSSVIDNTNNINAAKEEHEFRVLELSNSQPCLTNRAIDRIVEKVSCLEGGVKAA